MSPSEKTEFSSSVHGAPAEPPPPYSPPGLPAAPGPPRPPPVDLRARQLCHDLARVQAAVADAIAQNHRAPRAAAAAERDEEEAREVRRQVYHLIGGFVAQIQHGLPPRSPAAAAPRQAALYIAPWEPVPLAGGWHVSGTSARDNQILGLAIREGRVWPIETPSSSSSSSVEATAEEEEEERGRKEESCESTAEARTAGLWAAVDAMSLAEPAEDPRGALWWDDERAAQRLVEGLRQRLAASHESSIGERDAWACGGLKGGAALYLRGQPGTVRMCLSAEERTFRRLTEMGLWESKSGWTIVVEVFLDYTN